MFRTIVLLILLISHKVQAEPQQRSCLPNQTAAQIFWTVNTDLNSLRIQPLASRVQFVAEQAMDDVQLRVRFNPEFDGVSLPYNLYAVLIIKNGQVQAWWDYTDGCQGPGLSFFPGHEIRLPNLKLNSGAIDQLQIMIWGKL